MTTANLLVELFVEELPPKALAKLDLAFAQTLFASLQSQGLTSANSTLTHFATPRRLAAHITAVPAQGADKAVSQKLMPVAVGLDVTGKATPALAKKMAALGLSEADVGKLKTVSDGKADVLMFDSMIAGEQLASGLQKALSEAITKLPIPKLMSYQLADGQTTVQFVRPAHRLVALHGSSTVPVNALGLTASNVTQGHRFEGHAQITIKSADSYAQQLRDEGAVIASFAERKANIAAQLKAAASKAGPNLHPIDDDALLDEVTALVEKPNVLTCTFESAFLAVPQECLILTMKANQKYFPLLDAQNKLTNQFLVVSNIAPADPSKVIEGNERVVRPRLADAKFFFDQDRKKKLADRLPQLAKVVYHNKLGSQGERNERVQTIAVSIAQLLTSTATFVADAKLATQLSKADLVTDMVGEFPELQGIMGRYYALNDGLSTIVADAIEDHYKPRFAGDSLPRNAVGMVAALADKLETLAGLFSIGQVPTGDKDPFGLRRHALGVIRMLVEGQLSLPLNALLDAACAPFSIHNAFDAEKRAALETFIYDRAAGYGKDQLKASTLEIDAVIAKRPQRFDQLPALVAAATAFASLPQAPALAASNKRIQNILKKTGETIAPKFDAAALAEPQEKSLADQLAALAPAVTSKYASGEFTQALQSLAALKEPVDAFFDHVMVNAEDVNLRNNRLGLLASLNQLMNGAIDISKLAQ